MSVDNVPFIPRGPRHETTSKFDFHVQVERDGKLTDIDCWLIDLSRNGMKAWTAIQLEKGETAQVRLRLEQIGFDRPLRASVRWSDVADQGAVTGFLLEEATPLEVIGELILQGVIDSRRKT